MRLYAQNSALKAFKILLHSNHHPRAEITFYALGAHPQEGQEYLLCVKCNKATCPGCD